MISDDTYLFHWSIDVLGREFMVAVFHDGSMEWQELAAIHRAGGVRYSSDFISGLLGDEKAATRARDLIGEFKIGSPGDETAMDFFRHAGALDENAKLSDDLEATFDRIFSEQFWEHVNPQLPDPLQSPNE
jgi:hypothetical protein